MSTSPIILGLKRRFKPCNEEPDSRGYRVFTKAFDEVLEGAELARILPQLSPSQQRSAKNASDLFDTAFAAERVEIGAAGAALIRDLTRDFPVEERISSVVSLLVDHSGSMRGLPMMSALIAVEGAIDTLHQAQIATEVLGFTTTSWKGGKSRQAWRWAARPRNPGRLCDLRHIIYGPAGRSQRYPIHLRLALRSDLLCENIDGEALLWAAGRLEASRWKRRIVLLISDGSPVDDSTLLANSDKELLVRHLKQVQASLTADGYTIGTLLIGNEAVPEPDLFERAVEPQEAGLALVRLIRRAILAGQVGSR